MNDFNMDLEEVSLEDAKRTNEASGDDFFQRLSQDNQNLSYNYTNKMKLAKSKGNSLTHAKCACNLTYNKICLSINDLNEFHRPSFSKLLKRQKKRESYNIRLDIERNISQVDEIKSAPINLMTRKHLKQINKSRIKRNHQYMNAYEIFKNKNKLSLREGKFALFEHLDENPVLLANLGMADKLKRYTYSSKISKDSTELTQKEILTQKILGPFGVEMNQKETQKVPLVVNVENSKLAGITVMDNKMYKCPVYYFKPKEEDELVKNIDEPKHVNFLISYRKDTGEFFLREIDHTYVVGQQEPKLEVFTPMSKAYNSAIENKLHTFAFKVFKEVGYSTHLDTAIFYTMFPNVTSSNMKKYLGDINIAMYKTDTSEKCYFTAIPTDENFIRTSPEEICQFESAEQAIFKIREMGINNIVGAEKVSFAVKKYLESVDF